MRRLHFILLLWVSTLPILAAEADIPERPEELTFPSLEFEAPDPDLLRRELGNGIPVYIAEDRQLPLVTVQLYFKGGHYLEPRGKEGLASLTGEVWRTGGAGGLSAQALDEELDFLAARLSTAVGSTTGSVSLNLLSKDIDRGLDLFMDVLLRPRFEESRFQKAREDLLAAMKERNDSTGAIEIRAWNRLIYGEDYWLNQLPTRASVNSITTADLEAFHDRLLHPEDVVVAVAGDFKTEEMLQKLDASIGQIRRRAEKSPEVPAPTTQAEGGVYLVNKADVNQGRVSIGHLGLQRPVAQEASIEVANDILGGGGFTSWITSRVRSDEGLAYSAGSSFGINNTYPGSFRAFFQSKSATCARATQIILELVDQLLEEGVEAEELTTSKNSYIQTFPNRFQSPMQTVAVYAQDELLGRPHEYWLNFRSEYEGVDQQSVLESARRYLKPGEFVILVVGNVDEILQGDPENPEAQFEDFGTLTRLPLRDPMTLEPLEE